ncbi:hypothetical protein [Candidatus Magnetobacterium casense]|uniref:Uncharacterized protein n=1 Tax=Candidatus Magnetobacterium casense TaxID=1455061 RepID=A0ABS6RWJ9_9BACT|nr:hypothetical protein [Candidatus Magnetobacterium casensis]MBV6340173.1 hypothetical protein [Candidatus Magnetobacterium casensis]
MISDFVKDNDKRYQGTVISVLPGDRCRVDVGSTQVTAINNMPTRTGDQVLVSRLDNQWMIISKIRNGGNTMEVKV